MRRILLVLLLFTSFLWAEPLSSSMSGGNFEVYADGFSFVDTDPQTGGSFTLFGSGGEFAVSTTVNGVYELRSGFEALERAILNFSLTPSSVSFSNLSPSVVATTSVSMLISTASNSGYTVTIAEDGNLRSGSNEIADATSGQTITAGAGVYGIVSSGTDALVTTTTPIVSSATSLASFSSAATGRKVNVEFQLAIATSTPVGTYSHDLTFTITVNP